MAYQNKGTSCHTCLLVQCPQFERSNLGNISIQCEEVVQSVVHRYFSACITPKGATKSLLETTFFEKTTLALGSVWFHFDV